MAEAMSNESPNKTVLRLKRKRSEEPADLLLVSHAFKKTFKLADLTENCENNPVQRLFRLAGTVSKNDNTLSPIILNNLKRNEQKTKGKSTPQSVSEINRKLRERKQLSSERSRYKIVLKNRENEKQRDQEKNRTEEEISSFYNMYDAVIDDLETTKKTKRAKEDVDPNSILCNSVKMSRVKLNIDQNECENVVDMEDYVYDVYGAEDEFGELEEILDIVRFNECQLISEVDKDFDDYDDEDDSNDEDNWRNDYPDEDDQWSQSSDEQPRYKSEHFDYGWQLDDLDRGFGKLSSDEENDYTGRFNEYGKDDEHYSFEVVDNEDD